jgi:imidazolonepropionase-like amidohydrolase
MINKGVITGARILASGKGICITGGHAWSMSYECDTEAEVLKATRTQLKKQADVIKLLATGGMGTKASDPNAAQLTESQMRVAVEEAESRNVLTAAHCTGLEGAKRAIRAGVRSIEHARLDRETAELMKEQGAYYCPTIITRYSILNTCDPELQWLRKKANPQDLVEKERAIRLCLELGIPVCASTDSGTGSLCPLGPSTAKELAIYVEYGMTAMQALRSANKTAAEMLRLEKETGTIEVGKCADILLLDSNPLDDIKNLETLQRTYHKGVLVYQKM